MSKKQKRQKTLIAVLAGLMAAVMLLPLLLNLLELFV